VGKALTKEQYEERLKKIRELVLRKGEVHSSEVARLIGRTGHIGILWCKIAESAYPDLFYSWGYLRVKNKNDSNIDEEWLAGFIDADGYLGAQPAKDKLLPLGYTIIPQVEITQKHLAGFIDGDGCIACTVFPHRTHNIGFEIQPQIRIKQNEYRHYNFDILPKINNFLKSRGIKGGLYPRTRKRGALVVYGVKNVERLLRLITPYLQTYKKAQAILLLKEIIPRLLRKEHTSKKGFIKIMEFVDILNELRPEKRKRKYTKEFFQKIWGLTDE